MIRILAALVTFQLVIALAIANAQVPPCSLRLQPLGVGTVMAPGTTYPLGDGISTWTSPTGQAYYRMCTGGHHTINLSDHAGRPIPGVAQTWDAYDAGSGHFYVPGLDFNRLRIDDQVGAIFIDDANMRECAGGFVVTQLLTPGAVVAVIPAK